MFGPSTVAHIRVKTSSIGLLPPWLSDHQLILSLQLTLELATPTSIAEMADVSTVATSFSGLTMSAAPTSGFDPKNVRFSVGIRADKDTEQSLKDFIGTHNYGETDPTSKRPGTTYEDRVQLSDESEFCYALESILTATSWNPTMCTKYKKANRKVVKITDEEMSGAEGETVKSWRQTVATKLSDWKMSNRRASQVSKSLYDTYVEHEGTLTLDDCLNQMHRSAARVVRRRAEKSLPTEASHTMPRRNKGSRKKKASVQSVGRSDESDTDSVAANLTRSDQS